MPTENPERWISALSETVDSYLPPGYGYLLIIHEAESDTLSAVSQHISPVNILKAMKTLSDKIIPAISP